SSSKTVNMRIWMAGKWVLTVRTPSMPEILGRPISIRMTSGREEPTSLTTLRRLLRDATQRMPSVRLKRLSRLERSVLLSSTIAILIMVWRPKGGAEPNMRKILEDSNRMFIGFLGMPAGTGGRIADVRAGVRCRGRAAARQGEAVA